MSTLVKAKRSIVMVVLCLMALGISGCGTKGPLYIPEHEYPQN